jgi:hypothetical protein
MNNPVFNNDVAGIVVSSPIIDWLSATAFWIRPFDQYRNSSTWDASRGGNYSDAVDIFGLILPAKLEGWSLAPYFLYGWVGANSGLYDYMFRSSSTNTVAATNSRSKVWWLGSNLKVDVLDPLVFNFDIVYGHLSRADVRGFGTGNPADRPFGQRDWGTEGWFISATLDYKLDFMTPGIFGWWASGDRESDFDDGLLGRLPVLGPDTGFRPTSFGFFGKFAIENGQGEGAPAISQTGTGTWGIGAQLGDISFIKNLKHTLRVAYYQGTNDSDLVRQLGRAPFQYSKDNVYLTDKDSVWEVNFDHQYKIYDNLTVAFELGYLHLRSDEDIWGNSSGLDENDDAWKAAMIFRYSF